MPTHKKANSRTPQLLRSNPALDPLRALYRERHPRTRRLPDDQALIRWGTRELKLALDSLALTQTRLHRVQETFEKYAGNPPKP